MNHYLTLVSGAVLVVATAGLSPAAIGQTSIETGADAMVLRPTVDFVVIRESQLHLGMTAGQRVEVNIVLGPISPAGTLGPSWRACGGA